MESFIQKQEKVLEAVPSKAPEGEGSEEAKEKSVQEDIAGLSTSEQGVHLDKDMGELSPIAPAFFLRSCTSCLLSIWSPACCSLIDETAS